MALMTTLYRPDVSTPYYPWGPGPIQRPVMVSPAVAAVTPAVTINASATPAAVTPVQSGAPATTALDSVSSWFDQEAIAGISNKVLVGVGALAALIYFSSKKK